MMSSDTIEYYRRQAGREAKRKGKEPFLIESQEQIDSFPPFPFPNLGSHRPDGWEMTPDTLFCDKTGWGGEDEPALTAEQLKQHLKVGKGYAIVEEGEFQCRIGEFSRIEVTV